MKNKMWLWLLVGWLIGSYFGLSHVMGMFGSKKTG
jgi:hypothetical protein